ncbi:unnamed protein product [Phytophthora fragariaefolia]|uniref:Unnamed protein product n=1 Tax=Phytophthora fragariaefolia TaxID=1490495 RepID=A0A9W7CXP3_9STRA|nr:unnamed protein product [Phytophthora fragariaefolia]
MEEGQTADAAAVEAGWEVRHDESSGQAYYWNSITGETSWEPPPHLAGAAEEFPGTAGFVYPWTQAFDDSGRAYYLNTETMETRWTPPPTAGEHQGEGGTMSNSEVLEMTGGRGRRPSTAEQMEELNRLLSGEGEDEDDGDREVPPEGDDSAAGHDVASEKSPPVSIEAPLLNPTTDAETCPWMMFVNEDDDVPYYYNNITGECLWDPPEEFLLFHQKQEQVEQEQSQPQLGEISEVTGHDSSILTQKAASTQDTEAQEELNDPRSRATSRASSAHSDRTTMQVEITPEFEERVRHAIAAVSNTPVGSSRRVLVDTPTQQQHAPRTGRSVGGGVSARSIPGSGRPRSGRSRPSSGGAHSRPRTPGEGAVSSRLDSIPPAEGLPAPNQEDILMDGVEDNPPYDLVVAPGENLPHQNEENDKLPLRAEVSLLESEADGQSEVIAENGFVKEADSSPDGTQLAGETLLNTGSEKLFESAPLETGLNTDAIDQFTVAEDSVTQPQPLGDAAEKMDSDTNYLKVPSIQIDTQLAALTLQCMVRCSIARRRVRGKRSEKLRASLPETFDLFPNASLNAVDVTGMPKEEYAEAESVPISPMPTEEKKEELPTPSESQEIATNVDTISTLPLSEESPPSTIPSDMIEPEKADEPQSSARTASIPVQNSMIATPTPQQTRRDPASISTRLPSVLAVSTYFPSRFSRQLSSSIQAGTDQIEPVAISRKKVEFESPPRARQPSLQKAEKDLAKLEGRRREDERAQHAQIVEYQRIYAESRKTFKAELQRLLEEKQGRDNQRDHDIAVERRARIQAQRERDAKRFHDNSLNNETDRLVWEHLKAQGRPSEQNANRFREALAQALHSAQFPNKMCAERARELRQRIDRLHRTSWALDSQLESVELRLLSELHPLTSIQRPLQAKYAAKLRRRLEKMLDMVQSWQRVVDEWEVCKENCSSSKYWDAIKSRYDPASATFTDDETRRHYVLNAWRGAAGGDSLLHVAAWNGWEEHVRLLIDEGAEVNLVDSSASHRTPLHEACRAGHARVVELLLRSGADLSAVDVSGDSPLHVACRGGWTHVVRVLLIAANGLGDDTEQKSLTLEDFFNLRNGKGRRAMDVVTLPSLVEELQSKCRWFAL